MERAAAVKRLSRMIGKNFGYRVDVSALSNDEREAEKDAWTEAVRAREAASAELQRIRTEHMAILEATQEYKTAQIMLSDCK